MAVQHFQERASKAWEVILNGIPENQLIDGFVYVNDAIACSNNAAQIRNGVKYMGGQPPKLA